MNSELPSRASYNNKSSGSQNTRADSSGFSKTQMYRKPKVVLRFYFSVSPPHTLVALHLLVVNKKAISPSSFTGQKSAF